MDKKEFIKNLPPEQVRALYAKIFSDRIGMDATDPRLMRLPHHRRYELARLWEMLGEIGPVELAEITDMLKDQKVMIGAIIKQMYEKPGFRAFYEGIAGGIGDKNEGTIFFTLMAERFRLANGRAFQTRDALEERLLETDFSEDTPVRYLRLPYPICYFEFGETRSNPHYIGNIATGKHILEGAYAVEYNKYITDTSMEMDDAKELGIDPEKQVRVIEIILVGSAAGKSNIADDSSLNMSIAMQNEDEPLEVTLKRHFAFYKKRTQNAPQGPFSEDEKHETESGVNHLVKVLLYLNCTDARTNTNNEKQEVEERLKRVKGGKEAKLRRKLARTYNRIVVGPLNQSVEYAPKVQPDGSVVRSVKVHWRRGHFRHVAYGQGRTERRLAWIEPVLVNKSSLAEIKSNVPYNIR